MASGKWCFEGSSRHSRLTLFISENWARRADIGVCKYSAQTHLFPDAPPNSQPKAPSPPFIALSKHCEAMLAVHRQPLPWLIYLQSESLWPQGATYLKVTTLMWHDSTSLPTSTLLFQAPPALVWHITNSNNAGSVCTHYCGFV